VSDLKSDMENLGSVIGDVFQKFGYCAQRIKIFRGDISVDPLHIMKYPIFLIFLNRELQLRLAEDDTRLKDRIHALNKSLHGCSISYKINIPSVFFLNYATGIVLANTTYGENLVLYHGVTVGAYRDNVPTIGSNVVLMPNVIVSGDSVVGDNVVVSAGVRIINRAVPSDCLVFDGAPGELKFLKKPTRIYVDAYLQV